MWQLAKAGAGKLIAMAQHPPEVRPMGCPASPVACSLPPAGYGQCAYIGAGLPGLPHRPGLAHRVHWCQHSGQQIPIGSGFLCQALGEGTTPLC